jgi:DNA-binding IscR family transcriptional regulator
MSERAVALAVVLRLGERMAGRRGTVTPATLAPELSIDEAVLVEVLRRLEQGRIVIETVAGDNGGEHGLFLARDSATIALSEVVECVRGSGAAPVSSDARVASMVEELRRAERETLGGFTVRDLIERAARVAAPGAERETGSGQAAAGQA